MDWIVPSTRVVASDFLLLLLNKNCRANIESRNLWDSKFSCSLNTYKTMVHVIAALWPALWFAALYLYNIDAASGAVYSEYISFERKSDEEHLIGFGRPLVGFN